MITKKEREISFIYHILSYCNLVSNRLEQYNMSYEEFIVNVDHRDLISMPIMQIGELVNHLSDEFKEAHKSIPWHIIRGMRNWFAHNYYEMNYKKFGILPLTISPRFANSARVFWILNKKIIGSVNFSEPITFF